MSILFFQKKEVNYLTSTVAPASSSLALISSASAVGIFSFTTPLASTISLDSFNPNPVISLTTLITATFANPASVIVTLTVLGAASAAPYPPTRYYCVTIYMTKHLGYLLCIHHNEE